MSNIINTVKDKLSGSNKSSDTISAGSTERGSNKSGSQEPTFSIQPHPAKSNDPADLQPSGGLRHGGAMDAFNTPGPYIPSDNIRNNFSQPSSHDELQARQASLNNPSN